ncbi:phage FluMu protein Com [Arthrobacter sp. OAP107]
MAVTAAASRTSTYTEPHKCRACNKAFWSKASWNSVTVTCPHCHASN